MKLTFETAEDDHGGNAIKVTLDDKSVMITRFGAASTNHDLSHLPEASPGLVILEEVMMIGASLLDIAEIADEGLWNEADESTLYEVSKAF